MNWDFRWKVNLSKIADLLLHQFHLLKLRHELGRCLRLFDLVQVNQIFGADRHSDKSSFHYFEFASSLGQRLLFQYHLKGALQV